jgi:hypothetical protein
MRVLKLIGVLPVLQVTMAQKNFDQEENRTIKSTQDQ